ncbi:amidohydrolase family protein [Rhizobium binxianense]
MTRRCDSHVHVVGDIDRYPQASARTYTAMPASLAKLRETAAGRDVSRFVIVQPSFYHTDNTLLLETLDTLGDNGRGVAVIDPEHVTAASLERMHARGVRGLRANLYSGLKSQSASEMRKLFASIVDMAASMNWHVEIIAPLPLLAAGRDMLAGASAPVVIDHYGVHQGYEPQSAEGQVFLDLLAMPHIWIKLSAPYRSSNDALSTVPHSLWLRAILEKAPARSLWGSDWPYTPPHEPLPDNTMQKPYRDLSYGRLFDDFQAAVSDRELLDRILIENPARLYGFDA